MARDDFAASLTRATTRRTVVRTAAKLVYAAPVIAASFKLTAAAGGAQERLSPPTGAGCAGCESNACGKNPRAVCGKNPETGDCLCALLVTGECRCFQPICGAGPACTPEAPDCPFGFACVNATCCGAAFCAALCATPLVLEDPDNVKRWG